jgi:hypothetical protein
MISRATITYRASEEGKRKIQQARRLKGWIIDDPQPLVEASKILESDRDWENSEVYAYGISFPGWKRFLAGKQAIRPESFKAFCQVLDLDYQEIVDWFVDDNDNSLDNL